MYNEELTLTVTSFGKTTTISQRDDIDIHEFLETCRSLAIASGYHENSWKDAVIELANEYLMEEEGEVARNMRDYGTISAGDGSGVSGVTDEYLRKTPKTYTGKSDLISQWDHIPHTNC